MRRIAPVLVLVAVWVISAALWLQPGLVLPDGAGYMVYLPSAWIQHDLLFFDEWQTMGMIENGIIRHKDITATGHLGNHWTVGSALAWFPAFALADAARPLTTFPRNGISLPYNVAVITTSALAGLLTLLAGFAIARTIAGDVAASFAAIGVWFGTTLMWYSLIHATMSHAISAMAAALVFAGAMALRKHAEPALAFLAGVAVGFAFIVRPQNGTLALVPPIVAPMSRGLLGWYIAGVAVGALPEAVVSWFLYGSITGFLTGGGSATPFAAFQKVWAWEQLFSWYHGLLTWTPLVFFALVGLVLLFRIDRRLAVACLLTFALQWMINATMERSFWGALAFGQRRFDNCTVIFLIGLAALLRERSTLSRIAIVAIPAAWTFTLFLAARSSLIDLSRYVRPGVLFEAQWNALHSLPSALIPLSSTPLPFRGRVALFAIAFTIILAVAAIVFLRLPRPARAGAAAAYFIAAALFLFWTGRRDAALLSGYEALIARNRIYAQIPGGADVRFGLLRDEIDYLRQTGREGEARATEQELMSLEARRAAALRNLGIP
jgi:hypothetical protein